MRDHGLANGGASLAVRELVARIPLGRFREDGLSGPGLSTDAEQDNGGGRHQRYRRREGRSVRRAPPRVPVLASTDRPAGKAGLGIREPSEGDLRPRVLLARPLVQKWPPTEEQTRLLATEDSREQGS